MTFVRSSFMLRLFVLWVIFAVESTIQGMNFDPKNEKEDRETMDKRLFRINLEILAESLWGSSKLNDNNSESDLLSKFKQARQRIQNRSKKKSKSKIEESKKVQNSTCSVLNSNPNHQIGEKMQLSHSESSKKDQEKIITLGKEDDNDEDFVTRALNYSVNNITKNVSYEVPKNLVEFATIKKLGFSKDSVFKKNYHNFPLVNRLDEYKVENNDMEFLINKISALL